MQTNMTLAALALATCALMGCQPEWIKPNEASSEFNAAASDCIEVTRRAVFGRGFSGSDNRQAFLDRCIAAHGFRQVDPRNVPAGVAGHPVVGPFDVVRPIPG